jgi:hypothetical protein
MEARKTRMAAPAPAMAAPPPAVFLLHGRELMGNAEKDHLLQRTVVARFYSLFGPSPILCTHLWGRLDPHVEILMAARAKHLPWAFLFLRHYAWD